MFAMANGSEVEEFNQDWSVAISPEMISAGVAVLDAFEGEVTRPTLAEWVFQAMSAKASLGCRLESEREGKVERCNS